MIKAEKIIPGGQAIGTMIDGKKIFFWNALPEEEIDEYLITKKKSHYIEAIATTFSSVSKHRINPKDTCYLSTSPWQIMDYDYELKQKQELVVEVFREHKISINTPDIITDQKEFFYRNKMEYALFWNNKVNKIELAFHARGSHRKVPIISSSLERPEIFTTAQKIVDELNNNHDEARRYQSLLLRCNQKGEVSGGLYENHKPHAEFTNLIDGIMGREYSYSPNGFFQINLPVYELALNEIKKHINTENVLDLYAGVGTIGLSVAPDKHLTLVEVDKFAYKELCENCRIANISFSEELKFRQAPLSSPVEKDMFIKPILAKSEDVLDFIKPNQTVILDPPRAGCDNKLIDKLNDVRPKTIIYLSCNPSTQARDVKKLLQKYQIKIIKTFNFFPRTPHIENLVVLQ